MASDMAPPKKRWSDFSRGQQIAMIVLGVVELVLTSTAAVDLVRRPGNQIRGPKAAWWLGIFVQPVGPIAYLRWARHRPAA